jgi:hypothetical protein
VALASRSNAGLLKTAEQISFDYGSLRRSILSYTPDGGLSNGLPGAWLRFACVSIEGEDRVF